GTLIQLMPESTIGYRIPNSSVIFVFMKSPSAAVVLTAGRILTAGHNFHENPRLSRENCVGFYLRGAGRMWQGEDGSAEVRKIGGAEKKKSSAIVPLFCSSSLPKFVLVTAAT
ncbi:MAG TPA: hypothetical protein VLA94_06400, partial [Syntrophales bacterium]|nr:hypothetical protein [Syntrophales bacterium]